MTLVGPGGAGLGWSYLLLGLTWPTSQLSYYQTMYQVGQGWDTLRLVRIIMFPVLQYFLLIGLSLCLAAPAADERPYGPPPPAPVYKEPEYKPQPYEYKYGVADDYSKSAFDKVETQDEYGKVVGSYKVTSELYNLISPTRSLSSRSTCLTAESRL